MLLPGDVFSVVHPHSTAAQKNEGDAVVPCDALLISGSCIADEAVLTGALPRCAGRSRAVLPARHRSTALHCEKIAPG